MKITHSQKLQYLKNPNHCPFCNSTLLDGDGMSYEFEGPSQKITCSACGSTWIDLYIVGDIIETDEQLD